MVLFGSPATRASRVMGASGLSPLMSWVGGHGGHGAVTPKPLSQHPPHRPSGRGENGKVTPG